MAYRGQYNNIFELAGDLTSDEFELLVRHKVEQELKRLNDRHSPVALWVEIERGADKRISRAYWSMGSFDSKTEGEILEQVVTEQNRRDGFTEACKLKVLEHKTEETV